MSYAAIDANSNATITGLLNTNGTTITRIKATPTTHLLETNDGSTGSDHGGDHANFDDNQRTTLFAVSNVDGVTPVALYVDSSGKLLTQST